MYTVTVNNIILMPVVCTSWGRTNLVDFVVLVLGVDSLDVRDDVCVQSLGREENVAAKC